MEGIRFGGIPTTKMKLSTVKHPRKQRLCLTCGAMLPLNRQKYCCNEHTPIRLKRLTARQNRPHRNPIKLKRPAPAKIKLPSDPHYITCFLDGD